METATIHVPPEEIRGKIHHWILPGKAGETPLRNILCYLGLYTSDFPDGKKAQIMWDENEIVVSSKSFPEVCNCDGKDPKVVAIEDGWHSSRCNLAQAWVLMHHPDLVDLEDDETGRTTWTFQWPRSLQGRREVIQVVFTEVGDDGLWEAHQETWRRIVALMPEPRPSLATKAGEFPEAFPEKESVEVPPDLPDAPPLDYGADMDLDDAPVAGMDVGWKDPTILDMPVTEITLEADGTPALEEVIEVMLEAPTERTVRADGTIVPGPSEPEPEPETPEQAEKRKRGRPKGTTKAAKNLALETGSIQAEETPEGKRIPICQKFAAMMDQEMVYMASMTKAIRNAEAFPMDTTTALKTLLDRLALRAAHLEARKPHDAEEPQNLSPIIETTLLNVSAQTKAAVRDLGLAPEKPASWQEFQKTIKEVSGLAGSLYDVVSQTGMTPYITEQSE